MTYTVVIVQDGETARLACATLKEAQQIRQSFVNYGKCQAVRIDTPITARADEHARMLADQA